MGAIVDTVYLSPKEISILIEAYPDCRIVNQSHSDSGIQRYRVIIPNDDHCTDSYYLFLIKMGIAMSSRNFLGRIASDQKFVDRMRVKIAETMDKMKSGDNDNVDILPKGAYHDDLPGV